MTLNETLKQLKSLGDAKVRAWNAKSGAGEKQFGVPLGDIRALAKKIKTNHALALALWKTGNVDAQFLATLLIESGKLSATEMDRMVLGEMNPDGGQRVVHRPLTMWSHSRSLLTRNRS